MRFVANCSAWPRRRFSPQVLDPKRSIDAIVPAGYEYIACSSAPPYGPHVKYHKTKIWGTYNGNLENVRVIDENDNVELLEIENKISELHKRRRSIITKNFKNYRVAKISDFDPKLVRKAISKKEAESHMPGKIESAEAAKRGKSMGKMMGKLNKIIKKEDK